MGREVAGVWGKATGKKTNKKKQAKDICMQIITYMYISHIMYITYITYSTYHHS